MPLAALRSAAARHHLLAPSDHVLAAVSGGADSVALLRLLALLAPEVPFTITVAHVHHGLRGRPADEDEAFVADLTRGLGLPFASLRPGAEAARAMQRGAEEAARHARHALLAGAARRAGCTRIALGHTLDDQAETVLLRLLRGAGRRGLSGMAFAGPGRLIRPMLGIRRARARSWLAEIGQTFRSDETNADPRFLRNRVRARLLPEMERLNPAAVELLARAGAILAEEDRYLDGLAAEAFGRIARPAAREAGGVALAAEELAALPLPLARRVARLALKAAGADPRGPRLAAVEALLDLAGQGAGSGARDLAGGLHAARQGEDLIVRGEAPEPAGRTGAEGRPAPLRAEETRPRAFCATLHVPGEVELPEPGQSLRARVLARADSREEPIDAERVWLDADVLGPSVTVRTRLPGDVMHPLGAPGRRKVRQFLIDAKVPRAERDRLPLVVGPAGVAWVVGHRIGHPYRLTGRTRRVAVLERVRRRD